MKRILIASDKYKGSISGRSACEAIQRGLEAGGIKAEFEILPIADGGEGMVESLTDALGGNIVETSATDALGRSIAATYGLAESIAIIEMAAASGLWRIDENERDPWKATTFGTGELILDAMARGAKKVLLGIGGSATNDGGTGMAAALGVTFIDAQGSPVTNLPAEIERVSHIQPVGNLPEIVVACDVNNPLLGENGCTRIYGPQKGVTDFEKHEARLAHLVSLTSSMLAELPGAGAAGGLGFGSVAFAGATLKPGFDMVSEAIGLEAAIQSADLIITGEGKLDRQTLSGKGPAGVAELAQKHGKSVAAFGGLIETSAYDDLRAVFGELIGIRPSEISVEQCIAEGAHFLERAARDWAENSAWKS